MVERNFGQVLHSLIQVMPDDVGEDLARDSCYWAPEFRWQALGLFVRTRIKRDSSKPLSVAAYAILCNVSYDSMEAQMIRDGY